jgi:hypothetical protein
MLSKERSHCFLLLLYNYVRISSGIAETTNSSLTRNSFGDAFVLDWDGFGVLLGFKALKFM